MVSSTLKCRELVFPNTILCNMYSHLKITRKIKLGQKLRTIGLGTKYIHGTDKPKYAQVKVASVTWPWFKETLKIAEIYPEQDYYRTLPRARLDCRVCAVAQVPTTKDCLTTSGPVHAYMYSESLSLRSKFSWRITWYKRAYTSILCSDFCLQIQVQGQIHLQYRTRVRGSQ